MQNFFLFILAISLFSAVSFAPADVQAYSGLKIFGVTDNRSSYPHGRIPKYDKFEITFTVDGSMAENFQLPYDASPPPGVKPEVGISVNAVFTDPGGEMHIQPAFYYQEFKDQVKSGREWFYPTGDFYWKVRFAPHQTGTWKYRLEVQDAGGTARSVEKRFSVVDSANRGFVRVSKNDSRYFEFDDGTYFPALGFNMNYDHVSWENPMLDNEEHFKRNSRNGVQLVRIWLSQWGIYSSAWNQWRSATAPDQYVPATFLTFDVHHPESELSMTLIAENGRVNPCMYLGSAHSPPALKRNTDYHVRVRYKATDLTSGANSGLVAKLDAGWDCDTSDKGVIVTPYGGNGDWQLLEGEFNSGNRDFASFALSLENTRSGMAYIDRVWVQEKLPGGQFGVNIISRPWMDHHYYMEQRNSYAFDKVLDLAKKYDLYFRPVILEKNEWITSRIDSGGEWARAPESERSYGGPRSSISKVRWLQRAWWRYLQARWGYSPNIHSWELFNEADPGNTIHFIAVDEMGKFMRQFVPNNHLISSSHWHSFPKEKFWANPAYPNIDFADIHQYIEPGEPEYEDTAFATYNVSMLYGAKQSGGAGKPVIRGETGFGSSDNPEIHKDSRGIWLHNLVWGGINPGGLIESYWYDNKHIYSLDRGGRFHFDLRAQFRDYYRFIRDVPLNNGKYVDAAAEATNSDLRVWGQKDLTNQRAHLWIQNIQHTWKNVIDKVEITPQSGTIILDGFRANAPYRIEWWDTHAGRQTRRVNVRADRAGRIALSVSNLKTDIAVRIGHYDADREGIGR